MALAGTENRLFANHPVAIDMVNCAATIGDPPMPRDQLHRFVTAIFDANMIGPEPASLRGRRLIHQKIWRDAHSDTLGRGAGREEGIQYAGHKPAPFSA